MGISAHDREIQQLVNDVKDRRLQLPELQRRYVWKSTQVRNFFDSLYHQYPTGQLLVWETDDLPHARELSAKGITANAPRSQLLLDGQQRLTSLYAIMTGQPFIARDRSRSVNIVFNVFTEKFEVADASHHPQNGWVSLTRLFTTNLLAVYSDLKLDSNSPEGQEAHNRLIRLDNIKTYRYRVIVLEDITYDEVTEIFVRINSGGTRLGNADLTLAQISSRWQGIRKELEVFQRRTKSLGWELGDTILLRVLSALATRQARLSQFFKAERGKELTEEKLQSAWGRAKPAIEQAIHFLKYNCLIDRLNMLPTDYILVPLAVFFDRHRDEISQQQERDLQRWVYLALIWTRYSGSSETALDQDIAALGRDEPIHGMIKNIEDRVGPGRRITERELEDALSNSPFMVIAYTVARRNKAKDWFSGVAIGDGQDLEYHHIFPKAILERYRGRGQSRVVDQIANLAFVTQRANARIAANAPAEYLPKIERTRLEAQCVPIDPALWENERYEDFVRERRALLAKAINDLIASLMDEPASWVSDEVLQIEARIKSAEEDIRGLIEQRLSANFGVHAWKRCVPGDIQQAVAQRIEQRIKRNPFEAGQYTALDAKLSQCQFGDYSTIIKSNWTLFEDVFGGKGPFDKNYQSIQEARNAFAHHRTMNEGEQLAAASGLYWIEQCLRRATRATEEEIEETEEPEDLEPAGQ